jgi:[protein-PII] uridylyltransferase
LRDLADEEMLTRCALAISNSERLDLLALLSFADMMATGPKAQMKWRDTPVVVLYDRVSHLLEKGEPSPQAISERIEHIRTQVVKDLGDLMDNAELESYFTQLAPRYLLSMPSGAIARHLRLNWQLQRSEAPFIWEMTAIEGAAEITLMSWDTPGLLTRAAGILTLHDLNIVGAQLFTMNNGVVLLIFQCRFPKRAGWSPQWEAVKLDMRRLMDGKMALDYRIAAHAVCGEYTETPVRLTPSQILIDNESSAMYTILEVFTIDRVGLLYTISKTLFDLQIRIYVAKITTKVDQVVDVFYIKTHKGEKVIDPEQIEEVKKALCFWLDGAVRSH